MTKAFQTLIHDITYKNSTRLDIFKELKVGQQARVFLRLSKKVQRQLLKDLTDVDIIPILEWLDPDESTDILQLMSKYQQKKLIEKLNANLQKNISLLLEFDEKTAAGLMSLDYVQAEDTDTIEDVVAKVRKHENKTGRLPVILILSEGKLIGQLQGHKLVYAKPYEKARDYVKKIPSVNYLAKYEKVFELFRENPHQKVVVIGEHKNILGVIYSDDVLQILQENNATSLYDFAGVNAEESVYDSVKKKVNYRYKWLIINLLTTFMAAMTVQLFDETISKNILLAIYMPIVAGMGGNAGTQTLAVMVRSLSNSDLTRRAMLTALKNEVLTGLTNGIINGIIVASIVIIFNKDVVVAITLAFAMIVNLMVAATFGTLMPIIMKKFGKDPASSATIFITTATDIFGFFAFLGLATILLR